MEPTSPFFFFSSRRRHTRCGRDWSSDVCSSDLGKYKMNKFTFGLANHLFFANAAVINEDSFSPEPVQMDPFLGYEIDFTVKYQFADEVTIEAGYSHLFDTSTMREVKGTNNQTPSNWAYLMVVVKPFKNYQPFK